MNNFTNYVLDKRTANLKALKASKLSEANLGDILREGDKYGWKSWVQHTKIRSCKRDGNTRSVCIQYMQWECVCVLPEDPERAIRVEKIFFDSDDTLFKNMTHKINRNQMKAWYRLVNCVWNFNNSEEIPESVCGPLKDLMETLNDTYSFSPDEWKALFLTKPLKCPHEDDLPMIDVCTMLRSRGDHQALQALSQFWMDSSEDLPQTAVAHYNAVLSRNIITVASIQPWEVSRNVTNSLIACCLENESTAVAQAKALLDRGCDANIGNVNGWKPVHFAAFRGNAELLACLVVYGRVNLQDEERHQWRPLHIAADRNSLETVEFIVEWQKLSRYVWLKMQESDDFNVTDAVEAYLTHDQQLRGLGYYLSQTSRSLLHHSWNNLLELMSSKPDPARDLQAYLSVYGGNDVVEESASHWPCIDTLDTMRRSPLLLTSSMAILRYLLFHHADSLRKDAMFGSDALNNVAYGTSYPTPDEARNERIRGALLLSTAFATSTEACLQLLMQKDYKDRSSLMVAVERQNTAIVDLLIAATLMVPTQHDRYKIFSATIHPMDKTTRCFRFDTDANEPMSLKGPKKSQFMHPSIDVTQTTKVTIAATTSIAMFVVPSTWHENHIGRGVLHEGFTGGGSLEIVCGNRRETLPVDPALIGPGLELGQEVVYAINDHREVILVIPAVSISSSHRVHSSSKLSADELEEVEEEVIRKKAMPSLSSSADENLWSNGSRRVRSDGNRVRNSHRKEMCNFFQQHGYCRFGDGCRHAHTSTSTPTQRRTLKSFV